MSLGIVEADGWELEPAPWMHQAACAGADPKLFFPERGATASQAKAICARCPVRPDCLAYALRWNIKFGVWGGTTVRGRRRLGRPRPIPARCGTRTRYLAGCRCERCTAANRDYQRQWRARDAAWLAELDRRTLFESDHARVDEVRPSPRFL